MSDNVTDAEQNKWARAYIGLWQLSRDAYVYTHDGVLCEASLIDRLRRLRVTINIDGEEMEVRCVARSM